MSIFDSWKKMADIKKDLDEYLLLKSDTKKSFKFQLPSVSKPNISSWFQKAPNEELTNNKWFQESQHECCPSMSRVQRITGFVICLMMGILCFSLSAMYIPVLLLKARKFALLYTLGSLFFILSFTCLWGPLTYLKYMFSRERVCLTLLYGASLTATLYFALELQSTPLTVLSAVLQIVVLLWTVISGVPGGATGIKLFSKLFSRTVSTTLPV